MYSWLTATSKAAGVCLVEITVALFFLNIFYLFSNGGLKASFKKFPGTSETLKY